MPWNGTGTFLELTPPEFPAVEGEYIIAEYFNSVIRDLIAGLNNTLLRDAQGPGGVGTGTHTFEEIVVENLTVTGVTTIEGLAAGIPRTIAGWTNGFCRVFSADVTFDLADIVTGNCYSFVNISDDPVTIQLTGGAVLRLAGTLLSGDITVEGRGMGTIWCESDTEAYTTGAGVTAQ